MVIYTHMDVHPAQLFHFIELVIVVSLRCGQQTAVSTAENLKYEAISRCLVENDQRIFFQS